MRIKTLNKHATKSKDEEKDGSIGVISAPEIGLDQVSK